MMNKRLKICVTGCGGWIGSTVARVATRRNLEVVAIGRASATVGPWSTYITADLGSDGFLDVAQHESLRGVQAIVHCAGYAHRPRESPDEIALFDEINRVGTLRMIDLACRLGVRRIVYLSTIAFYDWDVGIPCVEDSPLRACTAYARSKLAGERACLESGLDCRVARLATVYGIGDVANFAKLAGAIEKKRFLLPGLGEARKSVLPVDLAAELLVDFAVREVVEHSVVNFALPEAPTLLQITDAFSEACGFSKPRRMPLSLLKTLSRLGDAVDLIRPGFPVTGSTLKKLTTSTVVATVRMQTGWEGYRWPTFRDTIAASADYYRSLVERRIS